MAQKVPDGNTTEGPYMYIGPHVSRRAKHPLRLGRNVGACGPEAAKKIKWFTGGTTKKTRKSTTCPTDDVIFFTVGTQGHHMQVDPMAEGMTVSPRNTELLLASDNKPCQGSKFIVPPMPIEMFEEAKVLTAKSRKRNNSSSRSKSKSSRTKRQKKLAGSSLKKKRGVGRGKPTKIPDTEQDSNLFGMWPSTGTALLSLSPTLYNSPYTPIRRVSNPPVWTGYRPLASISTLSKGSLIAPLYDVLSSPSCEENPALLGSFFTEHWQPVVSRMRALTSICDASSTIDNEHKPMATRCFVTGLKSIMAMFTTMPTPEKAERCVTNILSKGKFDADAPFVQIMFTKASLENPQTWDVMLEAACMPPGSDDADPIYGSVTLLGMYTAFVFYLTA